jgi:cell division protein FtsN
MQGLTARISEREQAGRTVYRVRVGPFERRAEADAVQQRLKGDGVDGQLVRVQRP